jgi:hypothetical protein
MPISEADVGKLLEAVEGWLKATIRVANPALMSSTAELDKAMEEARQKTSENGRGQRIN